MSTRCTIHFHWGDETAPTAIIYRHSDGYPDGEHGVPASLERFFEAVEEQTHDTRFSDAGYLAAKYVVWQADQFAYHYNGNGERTKAAPLDFLSLGVLMEDPDDIEFRYHVWCKGFPGTVGADRRPRVTYDAVLHDWCKA